MINQYLRHNLGYKQKIQVTRGSFSSSNVLTDTTVLAKDYMLNKKFKFYFKTTIK